MAFSPLEQMHELIGIFVEKTTDNHFEYAYNTDIENPISHQFKHKIWVTEPREGIDRGYRYGNVKKTVVEIVVDEDDDGNPIVEKWQIKKMREYK